MEKRRLLLFQIKSNSIILLLQLKLRFLQLNGRKLQLNVLYLQLNAPKLQLNVRCRPNSIQTRQIQLFYMGNCVLPNVTIPHFVIN